MDKFDEKVIGYDSIKETLRQIADVLKRPESYKEKGVSMPRGLLMESAPGLGKSLMASILMEESGRKSFVFRRINEGNTFLGEMKDIFDVAKEEAPSILLLEDLNLYVESNSPYAPEWACLQACIDETSDADIFVIATTNDTRYMPQSLLRPGRFDYILNLNGYFCFNGYGYFLSFWCCSNKRNIGSAGWRRAKCRWPWNGRRPGGVDRIDSCTASYGRGNPF